MVTVRCPNHYRVLTNGLWNLYRTKHGLDCELRCGKQSTRAHWLLLQIFLFSGDSSEFGDIQKGMPSADLLESLLEFLYKGTAILSEEQLNYFQDTARQVAFWQLVDAVEEIKRCRSARMIQNQCKVSKRKLPTQRKRQKVTEISLATEKLELPGPEVYGKDALLDNFGFSKWRPDPQRAEVNEKDCNGYEKLDIFGFSNWHPGKGGHEPDAEIETSAHVKTRFTTKKPNGLYDHSKSKRHGTMNASSGSDHCRSTRCQSVVYKCERCNFEAPNINLLTFHKAGSHDPNILIFRCSRCQTKFVTEAEMLFHLIEEHSKESSCRFFGFGTSTNLQLYRRKIGPAQSEVFPSLSVVIPDEVDCGMLKLLAVRYPNHHEELTNGLWNLLQMKQGLDYELKCGERSVRAHGVVLWAFLSTADSAHLVPVQKNSEVLNQEPLPGDDLLESVLEFLYKGTVTLNREQLDELQATARQLDFRLLVEAVEETKLCKPMKMMITRVDERTSGGYTRKNMSAERQLPKRVCRRRPATRKSKPPRPEIGDETGRESVDTDIFGSSDWQPAKVKRELDSDPEPANSFGTGFKSNKPKTRCRRSKCKRRCAPKVIKRKFGSEPRPSNKKRCVLHRCESCNFGALSLALLTFHNVCKHDPSILIFRCSNCRDKFVTEAEILIHIEEEHQTEFGCRLCNFATRSSINFHLHLSRHTKTEAGVFKCNLCVSEFKSEEAYDQHMSGHGVSRCILCDFKTLDKNKLMEHRRSVHRIDARGNPLFEFKCSKCVFSAFTKAVFNRHQIEKHSDSSAAAKSAAAPKKSPVRRTHRCTLCDFETPIFDRWKVHRRTAHSVDAEGNPISVFNCPDCSYSTMFSENIEQHVKKVHLKQSPSRSPGQERLCFLCRRKFDSEKDLEEHLANHETYKCDLCDYENKRKKQLYRHRIRVHSIGASGEPFVLKCTQCCYKTGTESHLREHMLAVHSNTKEFKCPYCSYSTGWKFLVNRHINITHLEMKPLTCDLCDFRTARPMKLREHKFVHTGERPFKCNLCDAAFTNSSSLSLHSRRHSEDPRPHVCCECGKAFKMSSHLATHMTLAHKKKRK